MAGCRVFGVRQPGGNGPSDGPQTAYLDRAVEATPEVLAMAAPAPPTEVLRLAATCEESKCVHFDGADCRLATRIVALLPPVVGVVPRCAIRADCRWHRQEGKAACVRCPQVVTLLPDASPALRMAAQPDN